MSTEDWCECDLGQALTLQRGFDLPHRLRREGSIPIISSSGVSGTHNQAQVSAPGIVTGRYGTIGEVFFIQEDFWPLNTTLYVRDFKGNDPLFLSHMLRTIDFESHSGKSGVPGVNRNDLHKLVVFLPPPAEQRAIAAALSDVDALLAALDALLAKKRAVKQATMQQLLTGATRLPGFAGEWERKHLGDVIERITGGGTPTRANPNFWNGNIPWATVKDITDFNPKETQEHITKEGLNNSAASLIAAKTLIVSTRMTLGRAVIFDIDVSINQDLKAICLRKEVTVDYLYYWFEYNADLIEDLGGGSTVKGLSVADLKSIPFALPTVPEQQAIAAVLADMDAEIEVLERRREKTRQIKQGMMQQLLTGRIRLLHPTEAGGEP